VNQS